MKRVLRQSDVVFSHVPTEVVVDSNYVALFDLGVMLNVDELLRKNEYLFENPHTAAMACFAHPRTTTMIFCSGKVLVVGARTENSALLASWMLVREMRRVGYDRASVFNFRVCNITSTFRLPGAIDILAYARKHADMTLVRIDTFPGITIMFPDMRIVIVAFDSGSMNITGCVHPDETLAVLDYKLDDIREFLVTDPTAIREVCERTKTARNESRVARGRTAKPKAAPTPKKKPTSKSKSATQNV